MKTILPEKEITILSSLVDIDSGILVSLSKQGLLNQCRAREILIRAEYDTLVNNSGQSKGRLMETLAGKYNVSVSSIEIAVYSKAKNKNYKKKKR
jgi:hypothetical protein